MNHELRTPLAGVIGVLELLRKLEPTKEQKKLLKVAQSCSNNLMGVINDILDFSKVRFAGLGGIVGLPYPGNSSRH
jgi:signal transduction histidine kinase